MVRQNNSKWQRKLQAIQWYIIWHYLDKSLGCLLVSEFPKSGGTWLCEMLAEITGYDFPRNRLVRHRQSILHAHYPYHPSFHKPVVLMRDGRDVMVSAYYHFLFKHEHNPSFFINKWRNYFGFSDFEDIQKNLPDFINGFFSHFKVGGKSLTWDQHIMSFLHKNGVHFVKYESLLTQPETELLSLLHFSGFHDVSINQIRAAIELHSFQRKANRLPGVELTHSFMRKGVAGDWKTKFSSEACHVFNERAGKMLITLGYEKDANWF